MCIRDRCLLVAQLIEVSHGKSLDLGMSYQLPLYSHCLLYTSRCV